MVANAFPVVNVNDLIKRRSELVSNCRAMMDEAHQASRSLTEDETVKFNTSHTEIDTLSKRIDLEQRQLLADAAGRSVGAGRRIPGRPDIDPRGSQQPADVRDELEKRCFETFLRKNRGDLTAGDMDLREQLAEALELRALSGLYGPKGGYTVPQGFANKMDDALKYFGGIITAAEYLATDDGRILPYPTDNDTTNTGAWIGENQSVPTDTDASNPATDPAFGVVNLNAYMLTSKILKIPMQLIQDSAIDIETKLIKMAAIRIGRALNTACTVGTGNSQPIGIVNSATAGVNASSPTAVAFTDLVNLEHSVDPLYRVGAKYMLHDSVMAAIESLEDSTGRPIFIKGNVYPGIAQKAPDMLHGYPVVINNDMNPTLATGNISILFGQLDKYIIRRVGKPEVLRFDELYMPQLQIGFMIFQRHDGALIDAGTHPVKYITQ